MICDQGDIVLVPFPFTDLSAAKRRPAVVVSMTHRNRARPDVILVAITSQVPASLSSGEIAIPDTKLGVCGLPNRSIVKPAKIVTLQRDLIIKRIGRMSQGTMASVLKTLRGEFGSA